LRAVKPVFNGPGCVGSCHVHRPEQRVLGFLEIDGSLERVDETIARTRWIIAGFTLAAVVLTILASRALVVRWIHRPVRDLVEATGRLAAGDLTWRVPAQRDRDFGRIASAFDRMAAGLEQAQRQVILSAKLASAGKLAAGVAHELNNPLTGILAFAEDLLAHAAPDDRRRADYEVIVRETRRCGDIVRDLLDFARQEMPEQRECDLHDIIGRAVALVERLVGFRRVRIERRFDPSLPRVLADSGQLQQVFLNLLTNAAEAMPDGGTITLATRPVAGGLVEASVADTGPGIPPEIRERIFEPFFSTKRSAAGHPSGQGLGLAVSWSIVERHRGKMSVESVVGGGTTFRVVFPAVGERGAGKP
jgi:two-component system NtrC family sensor kinase